MTSNDSINERRLMSALISIVFVANFITTRTGLVDFIHRWGFCVGDISPRTVLGILNIRISNYIFSSRTVLGLRSLTTFLYYKF